MEKAFVVGDLVWVDLASGFQKCTIKEISKDGKYTVIDQDEHILQAEMVLESSSATETPEDLTLLSVLNPPSILSSLKSRYLRQAIYTQCGLVLVAINPFTTLHSLYDSPSYDHSTPHVFKVAEAALENLTLSGKSQSIIISGESGAGKTSSARFIMQHLSFLLKGQEDLQQALLATNPLLEAFGNARTPRNDNSSRFGKYIKLYVSEDGQVHGGLIETFLLEKSRVMDESTFHIFSIIEDSTKLIALEKQARATGLSDDEWSWIINRVKGIDALKKVHISQSKGDELVFECTLAASLLGFGESSLIKALRIKTIRTKQEVIETPLSLEQAISNRNALARHLYSSLFDHLVCLLNKKLACNHNCGTFIGILDIYGFENFQNDAHEHNGFEQLCINYANEKLQNAFVEHFLHNEQQIYREEGLEWHDVEYQDNTACIQFIEDRLFALLEEESRIPQGTDKGFVGKATRAQDNMIIEKGKFGIDECFVIKHFAYDVEYEGQGFVEQNRDTLISDLLTLLNVDSSSKKTGAAIAFQKSLHSLMNTLLSTRCHYIRCIKPNQTVEPLKYDPILVLSQLEACGILATIQLSKAGYPTKWLIAEVQVRFWILGDALWDDIEPERYRIGKRYVFMKDGVLAELEAKKKSKFRGSIRAIQSYYLTFATCQRYQEALEGLCLLQSTFRRKREVDALNVVVRYYRCQVAYKESRMLLSGISTLQNMSRVISTLNSLTTQKQKSSKQVLEDVDYVDVADPVLEPPLKTEQTNILMEESAVETRQGPSEADIMHLLEENRMLKAQVAFLSETASTLNLLSHSNSASFGLPEVLSLLQQPPTNFDDFFTPARLLFHCSTTDLTLFFDTLKEMLTRPHTYDYLCFWISNVMELCGYCQENLPPTVNNNNQDRLVIALEVVQDLCVELFKRLQDDFFEALAISLLHHNSLNPESSSKKKKPFFSLFFSSEAKPPASLSSLLNKLSEVVQAVISNKMDISLTQPLFTWFLNNVHAHAFNLFMRQPSVFWTVHAALQVQLNLSQFDDYILRTILPLFQPPAHAFEFIMLRQLIKLVLFASNTEAVGTGIEYSIVCPELSRAQVRYALARIAEPALWVERALEDDLVNYGCGEEAILINLQTPQHFSLKLNLTPKTPPLPSAQIAAQKQTS